MRRGCLIVAVLAALRTEQYGYTLRKLLADHGLLVDEGTLYPLLRRLESQGLLVSEWREEAKRNKRFYSLSEGGAADADAAPLRMAAPSTRRSAESSRSLLMELLDRYLQAVRFFLPRGQHDDIIRELEENLVSQMEDREEELGRPLTNEERAEILRRHGHPMLVAGRYYSKRFLIGPAFFPIYIFALKLGVGAALVVTIVLGLIDGADARRRCPAHRRQLSRVSGPRADGVRLDDAVVRGGGLGAVANHGVPVVGSEPSAEARPPRESALALRRVVRVPGLNRGVDLAAADPAVARPRPWPRGGDRHAGPDLEHALSGMILLMLGTHRAEPRQLRAANLDAGAVVRARIALHAGSASLFAVLLRAGEWVAAKDVAMSNGTSVNRIVDVANRSIEVGLVIALIIGLAEIGREVYRLSTRRKGSAPLRYSGTI